MEIQFQGSMERSLLLEQREHRKIQRTMVYKKLKKRWLVVNGTVVSIILIFTIVAAVEAHQFKATLGRLDEVDKGILQAETMLSYMAVNKTIAFGAESGLQKITITSMMRDDTSSSPCIRHLNLSNTTIQWLQSVNLPTLVTLSLPASLEVISKSILGINSLDLSTLPKLRQISFSELRKVEKLDTARTKVYFIFSSEFASLKELVLENQDVRVAQFAAPKLEALVVRNANNINSLASLERSNLRSITCQNCSIQQINLNGDQLKNVSSLCNGSKSMVIHHSPMEELGCGYFPDLQRILLHNVSMRRVSLNAPNLSSVTLNSCPVQSFKFSYNVTHPNSILTLINTDLSSLSNLTQGFGQIDMRDNRNLLQFSNNLIKETHLIYCYNCKLKNFTNNSLPQATLIAMTNYEGDTQLDYFTNNKTPLLEMLLITNNKVRKIVGNNFSSLLNLNISGNSMDDGAVEQLISGNVWNKQGLKVLDMSHNNLTNKERVRNLLSEAFPSAELYI